MLKQDRITIRFKDPQHLTRVKEIAEKKQIKLNKLINFVIADLLESVDNDNSKIDLIIEYYERK